MAWSLTPWTNQQRSEEAVAAARVVTMEQILEALFIKSSSNSNNSKIQIQVTHTACTPDANWQAVFQTSQTRSHRASQSAFCQCLGVAQGLIKLMKTQALCWSYKKSPLQQESPAIFKLVAVQARIRTRTFQVKSKLTVPTWGFVVSVVLVVVSFLQAVSIKTLKIIQMGLLRDRLGQASHHPTQQSRTKNNANSNRNNKPTISNFEIKGNCTLSIFLW